MKYRLLSIISSSSSGESCTIYCEEAVSLWDRLFRGKVAKRHLISGSGRCWQHHPHVGRDRLPVELIDWAEELHRKIKRRDIEGSK